MALGLPACPDAALQVSPAADASAILAEADGALASLRARLSARVDEVRAALDGEQQQQQQQQQHRGSTLDINPTGGSDGVASSADGCPACLAQVRAALRWVHGLHAEVEARYLALDAALMASSPAPPTRGGGRGAGSGDDRGQGKAVGGPAGAVDNGGSGSGGGSGGSAERWLREAMRCLEDAGGQLEGLLDAVV